MVLQRGRWHNQPTYLVGFSQATLAASFSPIMYKPASPPAANAAAAARRPAAHHVVAVAGQDNIVTVWLAAAARPVVVLREVFQQPPSDLSWGADGYTLVVSGYDGTVVVLRFTPEELGLVLPEVRGRGWGCRGGGVLQLVGLSLYVAVLSCVVYDRVCVCVWCRWFCVSCRRERGEKYATRDSSLSGIVSWAVEVALQQRWRSKLYEISSPYK